MKYADRNDAKQFDDLFWEACRVQHGSGAASAYFSGSVYAAGGKGFRWVGFPDSVEEMNKLKAMTSEQIQAYILETLPDDAKEPYKQYLASRE